MIAAATAGASALDGIEPAVGTDAAAPMTVARLSSPPTRVEGGDTPPADRTDAGGVHIASTIQPTTARGNH